MIFRKRRKHKAETAAEIRFNRIMELVKDLDKDDYNNLKKAMDQAYKAYQTIRGIEAEDDDIQDAEAELDKVEK